MIRSGPGAPDSAGPPGRSLRAGGAVRAACAGPRRGRPRRPGTHHPRGAGPAAPGIRVDGRLDDAAWAAAAGGRLHAARPRRGAARERGHRGARRLRRRGHLRRRAALGSGACPRGWGGATWTWALGLVRRGLDSYHDQQTAFCFDVNPSGVRRDATSGDGDGLSWDAVWEAASAWTRRGGPRSSASPSASCASNPPRAGVGAPARAHHPPQRVRGLLLHAEDRARGDRALRAPGGAARSAPAGGWSSSPTRWPGPSTSTRARTPSAATGVRRRRAGPQVPAHLQPDAGRDHQPGLRPGGGGPGGGQPHGVRDGLPGEAPVLRGGARSSASPGGRGAALFYSRRIGRARSCRAGLGGTSRHGHPGRRQALGEDERLVARRARRGDAREEGASLLDDAHGARRRMVVEPLTNYFVGRVRRDLRSGRARWARSSPR